MALAFQEVGGVKYVRRGVYLCEECDFVDSNMEESIEHIRETKHQVIPH